MIKKLIFAVIGLLLGSVFYGYLLVEVPKTTDVKVTTQKPVINFENQPTQNIQGDSSEQDETIQNELDRLNKKFRPEYDNEGNLIPHPSGYAYEYDADGIPIGLTAVSGESEDAPIIYDEFGNLLPHPSGYEYFFNESGEPVGLIDPETQEILDLDFKERQEAVSLFSNSYHISNEDLRYFESINLLSYGRENPMWYWVKLIDEPDIEVPVGDEDTIPQGHTVAYDTNIADLKVVDVQDIEQRILSEGKLPIKSEYYAITSPFGPRKDPFTGEERFHVGLDIANDGIAGREVFSILNGIIEHASYSNSLGNFIIVNHGYFNTVYAHLEAFARNLQIGDEVTAGNLIGYVGTTGRSTGPHLHIEFDIDGVKLNPERFMNIINGDYNPNETDIEIETIDEESE